MPFPTSYLARGVDCNRGNLFHKLEELRLGGSRVTEEQDVDVTAETHAVGQHLARAYHNGYGCARARVGGM